MAEIIYQQINTKNRVPVNILHPPRTQNLSTWMEWNGFIIFCKISNNILLFQQKPPTSQGVALQVHTLLQ